MAKKRRGMLPGEYMEIGHVEVWPEGLESEMTQHGTEVRPDVYVVIVRRRVDGAFRPARS